MIETTPVLQVALGDRTYPIHIGSGLLGQQNTFADLPAQGVACVVTNPTVAALYLAPLQAALSQHFRRIVVVEVPDGEQHKTLTTIEAIIGKMLAAGCDRKTVMFALGGGVVGDMTGFAASCYMRGVAFVQVPTTLLAQVDSSVGGKTGVNHALGKNMIGAFYQPMRVICDIDTFTTLPEREFKAGLAEVIKYGPIADVKFLSWLESNVSQLLGRETNALTYAVKRSCEIKAWVVAQDEREAGIREILNFGHTFGHAIETGMGYGAWLHGEAIAAGMVMAADLSQRLGRIDAVDFSRIEALIGRFGLPTRGAPLGDQRYLELMRVDKKASEGRIRYVLLDGMGKASSAFADDGLVLKVIQDRSS